MSAQPKQLSAAISVRPLFGEKYKTNGNTVAQPMNDAEGEKFVRNVESAFKSLKKLPTGRALINEIDASGHTCTIICGTNAGMDVYLGAAILADDGDKRATLERYAIPFSGYATMLVSDNLDAKVDAKAILKDRKAKVRAYYNGTFTKDELDLGGKNAVFALLYHEIECRNLAAEHYIAQKTGYSANDIQQFRFSEKKITPSDNFKLSLGLYDEIFRGRGADTAVRVTLNIGIKSNDHSAGWKQKIRGRDRYDVSSENVRADVMLGHELVHAWRMMTGRRIVVTGWEEEMMTVGLGPGAALRFTENQLRNEAGHPRRTHYSLPASTLSGHSIKTQVQGG